MAGPQAWLAKTNKQTGWKISPFYRTLSPIGAAAQKGGSIISPPAVVIRVEIRICNMQMKTDVRPFFIPLPRYYSSALFMWTHKPKLVF